MAINHPTLQYIFVTPRQVTDIGRGSRKAKGNGRRRDVEMQCNRWRDKGKGLLPPGVRLEARRCMVDWWLSRACVRAYAVTHDEVVGTHILEPIHGLFLHIVWRTQERNAYESVPCSRLIRGGGAWLCGREMTRTDGLSTPPAVWRVQTSPAAAGARSHRQGQSITLSVPRELARSCVNS